MRVIPGTPLIRPFLMIVTTLCAVVTLNAEPACAQNAGQSERQRIAARVASEQILSVLLQRTRAQGTRHQFSRPGLPLETKYAVLSSSERDGDFSKDQASIVENALGVVALLSKDAEDLDRAITISGRNASDVSDLRTLEMKNEIAFNQRISPTWAANAVRVEAAIRSSVGSKLKATHDQLTAAYLGRFNSRPELLQPFAGEKAPSAELAQSRAAVAAALDDARKRK